MAPTMPDNKPRTPAMTRARVAELQRADLSFHAEGREQSPPKLRPGAAITFAIAAVVAVLSFIEVIFS